jgi:hypothetical protein
MAKSGLGSWFHLISLKKMVVMIAQCQLRACKQTRTRSIDKQLSMDMGITFLHRVDANTTQPYSFDKGNSSSQIEELTE